MKLSLQLSVREQIEGLINARRFALSGVEDICLFCAFWPWGGWLASFHQWHATIMPILQSAVSNLIRTTDGETHSEPLASQR